MRKVLLCMLLLALLCGCARVGANPAQQILRFRSELLAAGGCSFDLDVTADFGSSAAQFSLACTYDPETGTELRVTAPASIAGVTASVSEDVSAVQFDGVQIALGSLAGGSLAPLAAPYVLAQSWAKEYLALTGAEDGLLRATFRMGYDADELTVDTWFSVPELTPVRAEVSKAGEMLLSADIHNFRQLSSSSKGTQ